VVVEDGVVDDVVEVASVVDDAVENASTVGASSRSGPTTVSSLSEHPRSAALKASATTGQTRTCLIDEPRPMLPSRRSPTAADIRPQHMPRAANPA
jgi:hypothetical protein